jgi:hypothetical protein
MSQNKEAVGDEVTIYRSKKLNILAGVFVIALLFFGLTLPPIISGEQMSQSNLLGLTSFWFFGLFLTLAPLAGKFEVGRDYAKTYFLGICIDTLRGSDIETIKYGRITRWGVVGMGNGLKGWAKTKYGHRYFSFSETGYGKEAILHAKRVFQPDLKQAD